MTTTNPAVNGHPADLGCYVDGHWGQYALDRLADIAEVFGWAPADPTDDPRHWRTIYDAAPFQSNEETESIERLIDAADRVEDWLIDYTTGARWEWVDGELFLTEEDE